MRNGFLALVSTALLTLHPPAAPPEQLATLTVGDELYHVLLTEPEDIAGARAILADESRTLIPVGVLVRGRSGVNTGYSWHVDPAQFSWQEFARASCDGLPSDVERGAVNGQFCPWFAELTDLRPV